MCKQHGTISKILSNEVYIGTLYQDIFPDVPKQSGKVWYSNAIMWALGGMCWAVTNGVMKGTAGGKLMPLGNATRAEAATMFLNMLKAYEE